MQHLSLTAPLDKERNWELRGLIAQWEKGWSQKHGDVVQSPTAHSQLCVAMCVYSKNFYSKVAGRDAHSRAVHSGSNVGKEDWPQRSSSALYMYTGVHIYLYSHIQNTHAPK